MARICEARDQDGELVGYLFECPGCCEAHIFDDRWRFNGDLERPTLSPSYLTWTDDARCHSFVKDGRIRFLGDCTHDLAGQTVDLPEL